MLQIGTEERDFPIANKAGSGQESQTDQPRPNKYKYPEFEDLDGERRLRSILRKILPWALKETWEVITNENQANGNDAFLSVAKIAEARQRTDRKIRLDLAELEARQLLVIRHEWKVFRQADGSLRSKLVTVKDFEHLYDLAYEYLLWENSEGYIEPHREFAEIIRENESLYKKLRRFNNYRRILHNNQPGPVAQEKEIHRWYKEVPPQGEPQQIKVEVQAVADDTTEPIRNLYLEENLQEELHKVSPERVITNDNENRQERDSFDSVVSSEKRVGAGADYTKSTSPNETTPHEGDTEEVSTSTIQTNPTKFPDFVSKKGRAIQATAVKTTRSESAELHPDVKSAQQAMTVYQGKGRRTGSKEAKATPNPLIERFVREMSPILRDENLEGSVTRSLRAVEHRNLSQKDILACLVVAYGVARDTKVVREKYRRPDGDLRMPLFCTMFERFACQCGEGNFACDDRSLNERIAADERLYLFVTELRPEELVLQITTEAESMSASIYDAPLASRSTQNEISSVQQSKPGLVVGPQPAQKSWMSQGEAEELAFEILRDAATDGVTEAVPLGEHDRYVVILAWQGIRRTMSSPQEWRTEWARVQRLASRQK